jgi:hypothetical protein
MAWLSDTAIKYHIGKVDRCSGNNGILSKQSVNRLDGDAFLTAPEKSLAATETDSRTSWSTSIGSAKRLSAFPRQVHIIQSSRLPTVNCSVSTKTESPYMLFETKHSSMVAQKCASSRLLSRTAKSLSEYIHAMRTRKMAADLRVYAMHPMSVLPPVQHRGATTLKILRVACEVLCLRNAFTSAQRTCNNILFRVSPVYFALQR